MSVDQKTLQDAVDILNKSHKILITPSSPADGDSLGAALSLYLVLRKLGKEPTVVMSDDVPETYEFLPKTDDIHRELFGVKDFVITLDCKDAEVDTIKYLVEENVVNIIVTPKSGRFKKESVAFKNGSENFDLIVTVDAGDIHQMRELYDENKEMFESLPLLNIDHHASNSKFGTVNFVDLDSSSTTQALIKIIDALNTTGAEIIDKDIATLLLTGLITDTGSFQHANTTPQAFEVASRLLDLGAEQQEIIKKVYKTKSLSTLKLWGRVLSKIQFEEEYRLVWSTITTEDLLETNSTTEEANGIIDELMSNAPGAELILLLKQKADDLLSGSVRTNSDSVDGSAFAAKFGGGGHVRAAGFRIKGKNMIDAEAEVIAAAKEFQAARLGLNAATAPKMEEVMMEAEKLEQPVKSEEVVDKLTRDFVGKKDDTEAVQVAQMVSQHIQPPQQEVIAPQPAMYPPPPPMPITPPMQQMPPPSPTQGPPPSPTQELPTPPIPPIV
ncbi:MAG: DHH family phosphoesterase [Candidatus Peregrinibacteria bacterium]|nr:DHH family phosphoesterase [Candidatus Peregrinibacteria bacterium]MDZ4244667.1 DHH family phosphoesterase [Candidatus Gracilibacteria bacterium]